MKKFILPRLVCLALLCFLLSQTLNAEDTAKKPDTGERHEFVISNFHTESGTTLPQARVVYGTYGRLNAAKDNAVLLPSHYMADFHGYEWLIGTGHALDTAGLFLVATELFGNGHSSSPAIRPSLTTVRDSRSRPFATTWKRYIGLLTEELKITHLQAIIGFSMGAQQAFPMGGELSGFRRSHSG